MVPRRAVKTRRRAVDYLLIEDAIHGRPFAPHGRSVLVEVGDRALAFTRRWAGEASDACGKQTSWNKVFAAFG